MRKLISCSIAVALALAAAPARAVVTGTTTEVSYTGNASTTAFPFSFKATDKSWVKVSLGGVAQASGFTVTLNTNQDTAPGGTVTFTAAPASGVAVELRREIPLEQTLVLRDGERFPAKAVERGLDRAVLLSQQVDRRVAEAEATHTADKAAQATRDGGQDAAWSAADAADRAAQDARDDGQDATWTASIAALNGTSHAATDLSSVLALGSNTPRTLTDRFTDTINLFDYIPPNLRAGIVAGTEPTDLLEYIQDAVNAGASRGVPVVCSAGTYMIDGEAVDGWGATGGLLIPSNTHLVLEAGCTLKQIPTGWYAGFMLRVNGATNVRIEGPGTIFGDRTEHDYDNPENHPSYPTHEFNYGISLDDSTDVTIDGLSIRDFAGDAIIIRDSSRVQIVGNWVDRSRRNNISVVNGGVDITIRGNWITNAGQDDATSRGTAPEAGIDLETASSFDTRPRRIVIADNVFTGNRATSLNLYNSIGVSVGGNYFDRGLVLLSGADTAISGNTFVEGPTSDPAQFPLWSAGTTYRSGDRVRDSNGAPWALRVDSSIGVNPASATTYSAATTYVAGATVIYGGHLYVSLQDANLNHTPSSQTAWWTRTWDAYSDTAIAGSIDAERTVVAGNLITGFDVGIALAGEDGLATGNVIKNHRNRAVDLYGATRARVSDNLIYGGSVAVSAPGPTAVEVVVENNTIDSPSTYGVDSDSPSIIVRGNKVRYAPSGVRVTAGEAVIADNVLLPAGVPSESYQILCQGASASCDITGNVVRSPANVAIYALSNPSRVRASGNLITGASGNTTAAISCTSTAAGACVITANTISINRTANGGWGIALGGGTTGAVISGNTVYTETPAYTLTYGITTNSSAGGNRVTDNSSAGPITTHATDLVSGNTDSTGGMKVAGALSIGGGTAISKSLRATTTQDLASIAANTCAADVAVTVTGAVAGAECLTSMPAASLADLQATCHVSALDTVQLRVCNEGASARDPASGSYSVRVFNP
jgi:hypothetical protein